MLSFGLFERFKNPDYLFWSQELIYYDYEGIQSELDTFMGDFMKNYVLFNKTVGTFVTKLSLYEYRGEILNLL